MVLKKLCFCLDTDETRLGTSLAAIIKKTEENLSGEEIAVEVKTPAETDPDGAAETLCLADDTEEALKLKDRGFKVVGFLHEQNRREPFTGLKFVFDEVDQVEADSFRKAWERLSGLPWTILGTKRLTVRETTPDDLDDIYRIYSEPEITAFQDGLFEDPEDERRYLVDYIERIYGLYGFGVWTLILKDSGRIIGRAGFSPGSGAWDAELGFTVAKPYQGQGFAFEACEAILDFGFKVLLFERVRASVKKGNAASVRLCEKLGFSRTGEEKGYIIYMKELV